jgi:hypothetical protein
MRKSSYDKLKEAIRQKEREYNKLKDDFRRYYNGDKDVINYYNTIFNYLNELEKQKYYGDKYLTDEQKGI